MSSGTLYVLIALLWLAYAVGAYEIPLEARAPRALVEGTTRGFHSGVTVHEETELGWTSRFHQVKLYGGIVAVGEYYARVKIGGQTVRVQIDTGSATLAVPMAECDSCKKGDMRYDMNKSDSSIARVISCDDDMCEHNRCNSYVCGACSKQRACCAKSDTSKCAFHLSFGDGSGAQGVLVNDILQWGDVKFPVTFGGIRHDSPNFERKQVDGIMGMAYPRLACNPSCVKPTFESARDFLGLRDLFSICMTDDGGKITLGEFDDRTNTTAVTWVPTPLTNPPTFYNMDLLGNLQIGERELVLPSYNRAIVDSGTTLIVFSKRAFKLFVDHLQKYYCDIPELCAKDTWFKPAHCVKIDDVDRFKLPTLVFRLDGFNVTLNSSEYMINYKSKGPKYWCVGLMALDTMSGGVDVIFGNTVMKKYITIYDRENERVGFAESGGNCDPKHPGTHGDQPKPGFLPFGNPLPQTTVADKGTTAVGTATADSTTTTAANNGTVASNSSAAHKNPLLEADSAVVQCGAAKNCTACAGLAPDRKCFWDTPLNACIPGEARQLMCAVDWVVANIGMEFGYIFSIIVVVVLIVVVIVWTFRKRRQAAEEAMVDEGEQQETLQPLANRALQS